MEQGSLCKPETSISGVCGYAMHRGNSRATWRAGCSFRSSWPTAVWSCTQGPRLDMPSRCNRLGGTGWCLCHGLELLKRAASKPAQEGKTESVLWSWAVRGGGNALDFAVPTRSTGSDSQLMTQNRDPCDLSHTSTEISWAPEAG